MANAPFSGEFESLARQYWDTWSGLLGRGAARDGGGSPADDLPPGMDFEAFDWFSRIRQLAERFAQGSDADASAADIAGAWRQMLGGDGAAPFAGMLHGLAGGAWLEQMRPWLDTLLRPLREQQAEWLSRPAFGPVREHQQRLQALALAWQEWEQRSEAFNVLLGKAGQHAFERFERLLEEHAVPGKRLQSARALFDVWIDAAEEAWAGIALSDEYRHAYAEMTNALMRLRLGVQREVEHVGALLGLPGRSEVDALHRKVADLERTLHAMRQERTAGTTTIAARTSAPGAAKTAPARKRAQAKAAGPAAARATGAARKRWPRLEPRQNPHVPLLARPARRRRKCQVAGVRPPRRRRDGPRRRPQRSRCPAQGRPPPERRPRPQARRPPCVRRLHARHRRHTLLPGGVALTRAGKAIPAWVW